MDITMSVAQDGTGDFLTIQEAIDSVVSDLSQPTILFIKEGVYQEKISIPKNKRIHLVGNHREQTVITYADYARQIDTLGQEYGTFRTPTVTVDADDFYAENLTIANSAGYGPGIGQALALTSSGDRAIFYRVRLLGNQDTLYTPGCGRQLYKECYIEGHVDYIFGSAAVAFDNCHIHSLREGYITAASTPEDQKCGYLFWSCKLTGTEESIVYLGRPWRPHAHVMFVNTWMDESIKPEGWDNWRNKDNEQTARFMEYGSHGPGALIDRRVSWAQARTEVELSSLHYATAMLKGVDGWNPQEIIKQMHAQHRPQISIYLAGDSTMSDYDIAREPRKGWGQLLRSRFAKQAFIHNDAFSGRSSKSFIDEGRLQSIIHRIDKGDYLFIQFGHNDQKEDSHRYTEPNSSYKAYLRQYIEGARSKGAIPILITPIQRRKFDADGSLQDTHGEYPAAMRQLGLECNVPVIDLAQKSRELLVSLGAEDAKKLYLWLNPGEYDFYPEGEKDDTHLSEYGANQMAGLFTLSLKEMNVQLAHDVLIS